MNVSYIYLLESENAKVNPVRRNELIFRNGGSLSDLSLEYRNF